MNHARFMYEVTETPMALARFAERALGRLAFAPAGSITPEMLQVELGQFVHGPEASREPYLVDGATGQKVAGAAANQKLIAVIPVQGIIAPWAYSWMGIAPESLLRRLREAVANTDVKAIVLDFDSPGGSVYGIDELASEIFAMRSEKKIVAQVNPLCASAAYYLASQATEIACTPSGECGSIGVRMLWVGYQKMLEAEGIEVKHIFAGKYKVEGNPYEALGEEAEAFLQKRVDEYYEPFVGAVARGRGVKSADVRKGFGQGRVLGCKDAKSLGMVDRMATLEETIARLGGNNAQAVPVGMPGSSARASETDCECPCQPCEDGDCANCSHDGCDCAGCTCHDTDEEQAQAQTNVTTAEAEHKEVLIMSTVATPAAAAANIDEVRAQALTAERDRVSKITALANMHGAQAKVPGWVSSGATLEAVQSEILSDLRAGARGQSIQATPGVDVRVDADDKIPGSLRMMRMARCVALAERGGMSRALAAKVIGDRYLENAFQGGILAATPQVASTVVDGGAAVPENFVADFIPYLRPRAVVRGFKPRAYPLVNGNMTLPKMTGGTTFGYIGESKRAKVTKAQLGNVKFSAKKLAGTLLLSNDLLRFAGLSVDEQLRNDAVKAIAQAEDSAFLRAKGTEWSPMGLLNQANSANVLASSILKAKIDTPDDTTQVLRAVQKDIGSALAKLANADIPMDNIGIVLSRRTEYFFKFQVRDGLGRLVLGEEMANGTLFGFPYKGTTVIPNNLGSSGYDSEIYVADFDQVAVADVPTITVQYSQEATVVDEDNVQHNLFQDDLTGIKFVEEHDLGVFYDKAIAIINTVQYGA